MKNDRKIEFSVVFVRKAENRFFVSGRCYQGPILVNDTFTYLYQLFSHKKGNEYLNVKPLRVADQKVQITVKSIIAYKHNFEELDVGMTAELEVIGDDCSLIKPDFVLGNESK